MSAPEGRLYSPLALTLAGTLALMALVLAVLTIGAVIGPFRIFAPEPSSAPRALGLWLPHTAPGVSSPERALRVRAWRMAASSERVVRESGSLEALVERGLRVVALPDARTLNPVQADKLRAFVEGGGGVVLTGSVGVRGDDGSWRGYDLMRELLGVERVVPRAREQTRFLAAARRGPLSAALEPGQRIALVPESGAPAVDAADAELRWEAGAQVSGAALRRRLGGGRLVWLAAGPEAAAGSGEVGGDVARLVEASLAWAAEEPFVEVLAWPGQAPFAAFVGDAPLARVPAGLLEARSVREMGAAIDAGLERARRRGTLFVLSPPADAPRREQALDYARRRSERAGAWLASAGEISAWKRLRAGIDATVHRIGPRRHVIDVRSRNREAVRNAALRVHLNAAAHGVRIERTTLQQDAPEVRVDLGERSADVLLGELSPDERRSYTLDFEGADEAPAEAVGP